MSTFVGKVNYDRPFMDHIGWKKDNSFTEKMNGRLITIERWSSMIDRTQGIYEGKIDMASKVNDDRPMVNYDRPRSSTQER